MCEYELSIHYCILKSDSCQGVSEKWFSSLVYGINFLGTVKLNVD